MRGRDNVGGRTAQERPGGGRSVEPRRFLVGISDRSPGQHQHLIITWLETWPGILLLLRVKRHPAIGSGPVATNLQDVLTNLPKHYRAMQEVTSYGTFFNFFMCGVRIQTDLGTSPWIHSDAARC